MKFLEYIPIVNEGNIHVAASILVLILLAIAGFSVYRKIKSPDKCIVPPQNFSLTNIFELIVETTLNMSRDIIGKDGEKYVPFIGTIFVFILTCNLLGMIPGFIPPTENVNTNLACAIVVFLTTHYFGIREHGLKYIKKFMGIIAKRFVNRRKNNTNNTDKRNNKRGKHKAFTTILDCLILFLISLIDANKHQIT